MLPKTHDLHMHLDWYLHYPLNPVGRSVMVFFEFASC